MNKQNRKKNSRKNSRKYKICSDGLSNSDNALLSIIKLITDNSFSLDSLKNLIPNVSAKELAKLLIK